MLATAILLPFLALLGLTAILQALFWAWGPRPCAAVVGGSTGDRILILVPAHNERARLPRCLDSLQAQTFSEEQLEILVLADRCTDGTVEFCRERGVRTLERLEGTAGKGPLLDWALQELSGELSQFQAVAVLDGDSAASHEWLERAHSRLVASVAVQAHHSVALRSAWALSRLMSANARVRRRILGARDRLGLASPLLGTGMVFRTESLVDGWPATGLAEDREWGAMLVASGETPAYDAWSRIEGSPPDDLRSGAVQRQRWMRGELRLAASHGFRLIGRGIAGSVVAGEFALQLLTPSRPMRLVLLLACVLGALVTGHGVLAVAAAGLGALEILPLAVTLVASGPGGFLALLSAPFFLLWRLCVGVRSLLPGSNEWRSTREGSPR